MNILSEVEAIGTKIGSFLTAVVKGAATLQSIWGNLSGPTLAVAAAIFYDVVKLATAGGAEASALESGNFGGVVALSPTTLGLLKQFIADVKAGEKQVVADVEALKLTFGPKQS